MDWFTRAILCLLGWRPVQGRDSRRQLYVGWVRGNSYFHVYHEGDKGKCIRP